MARSLITAAALFAAVASIQPALARDPFIGGSNAYTVGMYGSAARQWLDLAEKGHGPAQYNVGHLIYHGRGMRRDRIEAYKWFLLAHKNGIARGTEAMRIIGFRMTSREIAEARVRAREWELQHSG